jgi:hypothetical protein
VLAIYKNNVQPEKATVTSWHHCNFSKIYSTLPNVHHGHSTYLQTENVQLENLQEKATGDE